MGDLSMSNMAGRPGYRTLEMNGGSSASYLARTPCVPLFSTLLNRDGTEGLSDYQGKAGIISIVRWNRRAVIFGVECRRPKKACVPNVSWLSLLRSNVACHSLNSRVNVERKQSAVL